MRRLLLMLAALCLTAWSAAFFLIRAQTRADDTVIPTLMVLPSLTPTDTPSPTVTPTLTPSVTTTLTSTPTETLQPTPFPTLSVRVLEFSVVMPGVVLETIDAYADELTFPTTDVYFVGDGTHRLEIRAVGRRNSASSGYVVGLDAVHIWRGDARTLLITPAPPPPASSTPRPARVGLVSAPPTVQPTVTPVPPRVINAQVVIAYDENGNRTVDPAEGVAGISVRVVEVNTNRVIASGFTDERGYVSFEVVTDVPAQVVVPYFGRTWQLQRGGNSAAPAFTLLLTPGNQPGLIP